jgi:KDO2-lipid IV(A) lauroyltransferase
LGKRWLKKRLRPVRHWVVYVVALGIRRLVLLLPLDRAIECGGLLGWLAYFVLQKQRLRTLRNLQQALPELATARQRRQLAREVFRNCGRGVAEGFWLARFTKALLAERIKIVGAEHLLGGYAHGRGFIGVSAHLGNWELLAAYLARVMGISFGVVARELSNPWMNTFLLRQRKETGINVIVRGESGIGIFRRLAKGEGVGILADQDTKGEGVFVNFFGQPAYTQTGVAHLCVKTGADIIPLFIVRNDDGLTHTIFVERALQVERTEDENRDVREITQRFTAIIEDYIRRYPAQWVWFHRRWRRRPACNE